MRRQKNGPTSIRGALLAASLIISVVMMSVFLAGVMYYNSVVLQYQTLVENVSRAMSLTASVKTEIDSAGYGLVSGKTRPEDSIYSEVLRNTRRELTMLEGNASFERNRSLLQVAKRTLSTIEGYFEQLIDNIESGAPVRENEELLDDIQQVTELLDEVIIDYTANEVQLAEQRDANLQQVNLAMNIVQMVVCGVAIGFLVFSHRLLEKRISEPVNRMQDMAGRIAAGDFEARMQRPEIEELDDLALSMNQMAGQIRQLMDANIEKQKELRKAEIQILQAQISPHFLYNTLDTIVALAESDRLEDVVTTTVALSNFHRISLSRGNDWIPVSQEAAQIESYLTIQKMRYGMQLDYEIDIDDAIRSEYMLKILLQPLVENAIYHGVKLSRKGGLITVEGRREDDRIVFRVRNTGPGMDNEQLAEVRAALGTVRSQGRAQPVPKGYGLSNVYQRIRLFYEVEDGLEIESDTQAGTTVTLRLPVPREGG